MLRRYAVFVIALFALAACGAPAGHADRAGYRYPASAEATFRRDFADRPGVGDCALATMERHYSYNDILAVSRAYAGTGELPPTIKAILDACVAQAQ